MIQEIIAIAAITAIIPLKVLDVITTNKALATPGDYEADKLTAWLQRFCGKWWWVADGGIIIGPALAVAVLYAQHPDTLMPLIMGAAALYQGRVVYDNAKLIGWL